MRNEHDTLQENHTWTLVPRPLEEKVLSNRWVFKTKRNQGGEIEKYKAILVALGNMQQQGVHYQEVFAPVSRETCNNKDSTTRKSLFRFRGTKR